MINTFQAITLFGTGDPKTMANGISEALVTTMLGLMTAIPATFMAIKVAGMAVIKPSIVVTNASEIPFAIVLGSPVPNKVIAWKVFIIPVIVPNKPSNGATTEISLFQLLHHYLVYLELLRG